MNTIASLADVLDIESRHAPTLPESTYDMIAATARAHPDKPALSFFLRMEDHWQPQRWTYQALFGRITAAANAFHALGVGPQDVVAFALPNLPQTHFTIWGAQATGISFAINPLTEPAAIAELLAAAQARVFVTLAPQVPGSGLWAALQPLLDKVPSLRHVLLVDPAGAAPALPAAGAYQVHEFDRLLDQQATTGLLSTHVIRPDDLSSYFCTGGTTGTPKIAMRTHGNEVANAWSVGCVLGEGIGPGKTLFCGLPLFHVNAVLVTGLLPFSRGAHVLLGTPHGYRGEGVLQGFWSLVEQHRINFFSGVPTVYATLLQMPTTGHAIDSLEYGLCGAAPLPMELMRRFEERTGLKILEGYGLTEGTCVSSCNPPGGERRTGSIGLRLPLQAMKAVLLDEAGAYVRDCAIGEVGVLAISGPNVFAGYRGAGSDTGPWLDLGDGRRWLNTGDLGRQDEDGYFYLTGRKKDLIIRGGHNIDPTAIEEPLHRHSAIQFAAAVGRPDRHAGELPVAYVQLKSGACATEAELLAFARQQIAERAAVPKAIRIVEAMPLTSVGKIFKPALRRLEISDALQQALREGGVEAAAVNVQAETRDGTFVQVILNDAAAASAAREVLGGFPFRFELASQATPVMPPAQRVRSP